MEVHTHTHTPRKKWTHYFWEFLMLFVAVFCGFLAENQREHFVEHQREKQFMRSLKEDLERDILDLTFDIPFWDSKIKKMDSIRTEIQKPVDKRDITLLYKLVNSMRDYNKFLYHDRTISQLKNGGSFRLIRNEQISDTLISYDAMVNSTLRDMESHSNNLWEQLNFLQNKIFDARYYSFPFISFNQDSAIKANPQTIGPRKGTENELFEYSNHLEYFQGVNMARNYMHNILLKHGANLIDMIKEEYHLK